MATYQPPNSEEAEQGLLGAIFISPEIFFQICDFLHPDDFYSPRNAKVFQAMFDLQAEDIPIDTTSVTVKLKDKGQGDILPDRAWLSELSEAVGKASNGPRYAQIVHDKATLRRLIDAAQKLSMECFNGKAGDIQKIIESHQHMIAEIEGGAKFKGSGKNIAKRVREYCEATDGDIKATDVYKGVGLATKSGVGDIFSFKKAVNKAMERLVKEGVISRIKKGVYRLTESDAIPIKLSTARAAGDEIPMRYPFGLERYFVTYSKTIVLISGEPDSGKTALLLNIAKDNMHLGPIYYWTSEMGGPELYSRVENFEDFDVTKWDEKVNFAERSEEFEDVVKLYPDAIHIIDNLELHDNFYLVGGMIDAIWRALGKGVVIIGLHKDKGKDYAQGGMASIKRPRLWLDLSPRKGGGNQMKVGKFKNWRDKLTNIKNMTFDYHLIRGCKIVELE